MASRHRDLVKKRTLWLFIGFALMLLGLAARLAYVQVLRNEQYEDWAKRIRFRDIAVAASRGSIFDRNGRPLATSIEACAVFANRSEVGNPTTTVCKVAEALDLPEESVRAKFGSRESIVWLARQVDPRRAETIRRVKGGLRGVGTERDPKRVYPAGSLAAHVLGFTSTKNDEKRGLVTEGVEGIECALDGELAGAEGLIRAELDARRRPIPETRHLVRRPRGGRDVYLTIDLNIQHITEVALDRVVEKYCPARACAIVMDPHTGEILALANYPRFDPNRPRSFPASSWRDSAVSDLYEPGSTLKVVTVAAALNEGVGPRRIVAYCNGRGRIKGGRITCLPSGPFPSGHGSVDMHKIIGHSCNIGAAQLGLRLGARKLYRYEKAFGLIDKTRSGLTGEARTFTMPPEDWCRMRLANVGFGQGIAVTPLQMGCAYSTIANGGVYVQPQIVREIRNADGSVHKRFQTRILRRVISREAAVQLTQMMVGCVEEGTGKAARIAGRTVAGKTGSAQIGKPKGGFEEDAFVSSFMGFVPANSPRMAIVVVVTRPQGSHWGATVAAPVFREIAEKSLWYMKVPADALIKDGPPRKQDGDGKGLV